MKMFKGMIAAFGIALAATMMTASADAQPGDRHGYHDNRGPQRGYGHGPNRGHHWNNGRRNNWRNHHRNCRTMWRHHHRVTRCR